MKRSIKISNIAAFTFSAFSLCVLTEYFVGLRTSVSADFRRDVLR